MTVQDMQETPYMRRPRANSLHAEGEEYLVLPFKFCPHASELHVRAAGRADVIHDVNVNVIENHHTAVCICCGLIHNVAEDGPGFCR